MTSAAGKTTVPTLGHDVAGLPHLALEAHHDLADGGVGRYRGDGELHLGRADLCRNVAPVGSDGLAALGCPELDGDVASDCGHRLGVLGVNSQAQALCRHGAVHCPRVQEREAKAVGNGVCDGGLAGPGRPVDGYNHCAAFPVRKKDCPYFLSLVS